MYSSSILPPECILPIVEHLFFCREYATLSSLLRTSKSMFRLVAPVVFGEPFAHFAYSSNICNPRAQTSSKKLCRALLSSRPVEKLPKVLQLVYFPEYSTQDPPADYGGSTSATSHLFNYPLYIRHLHFSITISMHPDFSPRYNSKQALPLEEHIVSELTEDVERFLVQDGHLQPDPNRLNTYSQLLDIHLRTVLTWALCEPFLEQIRSIDIPLSDIDGYLAVVHRFRSLSYINFINDFAMDCQLTSLSEYSQIDFGRARLIEGLKTKAIDSMIQLTEEATRLHGSQLRQVDFQSQGAISFQTKRPTLIMERISRALPPLDRPRVLDESNWVQLAKHIDSTCLDRVTRIFTPFDLQWRANLAKVGPIWTECRSLEALEARFYPTPVSCR